MSNFSLQDAELWTNMIENMLNFTEASSFLINSMQTKLGIEPDEMSVQEPLKLFDQFKSQLTKCEPASICQCASPEEATNDSDEDLNFLMGCHQPPRIVKKKIHKYPPDLESKIKVHKRENFYCRCVGNAKKKMQVDTCLCDMYISSNANDTGSIIATCSSLNLEQIENVKCKGRPKSNLGIDPVEKEPRKDSELSEILHPGAFKLEELPQDDTNPFILKDTDDFPHVEHILGHELFLAMKRHGEKIAQIDSSGKELTYSQLYEKCVAVAVNLKKETKQTDIVGVCTNNNPNSIVPYIAALWNGNRAVAFDRKFSTKELASCLKNVTPKIVFVENKSLAIFEESMKLAGVHCKIVLFGKKENYPSLQAYCTALYHDKKNYEVEMDSSFDSTALISFLGNAVSDTPKAVCLSHYGIVRQVFQLISYHYVPDVFISFQEISDLISLLLVFGSIFAGSIQVIEEDFRINEVWNIVKKYKVKTLHVYPHQCIKLSKNLPNKKEKYVSFLNYILTGGETINPNIIHKLQENLPGVMVCQVYEHTELSGVTACFNLSNPQDETLMYFSPKSCGKKIGGISYKVCDLESGMVLNHSSPGELNVKSRMVFNGYYSNNVEETYSGRDNWCRTGDLAMFDYHGHFRFLGKKCDVIRNGGKTIYPYKLEDILMSHPAVEYAVVLGAPDPVNKIQEIIYGFVTLNERDSISGNNLKEFINSQVSVDEFLYAVKVYDKMPLTETGKINRRTLKKSCICAPEK